jgi:dnd system-associated protein 4
MSRIRRDKKHELLMERLTKGDEAVFTEIWRVLVFAAFIGAKHNKRSQIINIESGKAFPENYLQPSCGPGFLSLLGINASNGNEILKSKDENKEELIMIFEEYANGGMEIITERVDSSSSPLEAILGLLDEPSEHPRQDDIVTTGLI